MKKRFLDGMRNRGLTPVENVGDGNCVFIALAELVFGDASKFEFMRYMIVHRLQTSPQKYFHPTTPSPLSTYCHNMLIATKPCTHTELQSAADSFFSTIELYSTKDHNTPATII
jgi:hypothetical protein